MADGVWRTVSGRRIFIADGQSLTDAMKKSGKFNKKKTKLEVQTEESDLEYAKRKLKEAGDDPIMKRAAERKLKEAEKKNSNNEDDSYAYKKNWSKENAEKYIASQLKNNEGYDSVLLEKNGHYAVAKNWKEAEDAIKQGWKHEKEDVNKIRKMAGLDKSDEKKQFSNGRTEKTYEPKKLKNGLYKTTIAKEVKGDDVNQLIKNLKSEGYELESADAYNIRYSKSFNDTKVTLYDKNKNEYIGLYNKYSDGGREIIYIEPKKKK